MDDNVEDNVEDNVIGIEFLKHKLIIVETKRNKIQEKITELQKLDNEIQAIKFLISKYMGKTELIYPILYEMSISSFVYKFLSDIGKPQTTKELLVFLASKGKQTTSATLRSTIYGMVKRDKLFKVISPGLYGLKDWK